MKKIIFAFFYKNYIMKKIKLTICFIIILNFCFSQIKYERESCIKIGDVPNKAKLFVDSIAGKERLKWYKEDNIIKTSIEAKFKIEGKKYSVEFDTLGNLEDIELLVKKDDIKRDILNKIRDNLKEEYLNYKIIKIQKQYKGDIKDVVIVFKNNNDKYLSGYEVIVRGKTRKDVYLYEYFFNKKGDKKIVKKIILKTTDHLDY